MKINLLRQEVKVAKDLPIDSRIVEQLAKATVKNMVDGIVELITNCDDSYKRIELNGQRTCGEIKIYVNRKKGGICERLIVEDFAEGMTKEELEKAIVFGGETSGFESGRSVRGLFGRGLKETIIALGEGEIKTIKNCKACRTKLWFNRKLRKPQYDDELLNNIGDSSEKDGTEIDITITNEKIRIPEYKYFKDQVSKHYALRDINGSKNRMISLVFDDVKRGGKTTTQITFLYPEGKKVKEEIVKLPGYGDEIRIIIYESPTSLDSPRNNPFGLAGILIKTKGATLDNQLFKFDNDPIGLYFFGEAICEGLEERLRKGETEIIDPNRGGLEWRHEYCRVLSSTIEKILEPLILEKRKTLEKRPEKEIRESTKKMLQKLCNLLNELAKKELDITEEPPEPPPDIKDLTIIPTIANVQIDKPRVLSVWAPDEVIKKEGQEAHIKSDTIDIHPLASVINLEKSSKYPETLWSRYFKVAGNKDGAVGTITVKLGNKIASATVKVAPPRKIGPRHQRKGGFISNIIPDELDNPSQRVFYDNGIIKIYVRFPSVFKFIKSRLEGVETPEGRILLAELVGEAFCKELAMQKLESGDIIKVPGAEIDSFNTALNEIQKKHLHKIQEIIFAWKF